MSTFVTVVTKVASNGWVIEQHRCFPPINFKKNPQNISNLRLQSSSVFGLGVKWRVLSQLQNLPEGWNMWRMFFYVIAVL